jgi:hypothetical protein
VPFAKYNYNEPIKENEMGKSCNTEKGQYKYIKAFWWERKKEKDYYT